MIDSMLGSIADLVYNRGTKSVKFYWIPPSSGRLVDFHSQFNKTSKLRPLDGIKLEL